MTEGFSISVRTGCSEGSGCAPALHFGDFETRSMAMCSAAKLTNIVLLSLLAVPALAGSTCADETGEIVIERVEWGFDGKAVEQTFVPLSILMRNNSLSPVEGTLRLTKSVQLTQQVGAAYEQTFYVSGESSRWVPLTPYVIDDFENWSLRWGEGRDETMSIPTPRMGKPATVLVVDPNIVSGRGGAIRRFDPMRFPVSVTGTDALGGVVFDRPPGWQGAREAAFLEWLMRGGRLTLLLDENGVYPTFAGDLAPLNRQRERFFVGAGVVQRIPLTAPEIDAETMMTQILKEETEDGGPPQTALTGMSLYGGAMSWDRDRDLFDNLRQAVSFHRRWWLIYAGVLLYLLAHYPGCYVLGRKAAQWRNFYAGFLGVSVAFSLLFAEIGRVGGGEANRIRTAAIARQLEEGLYDTTGWSCLAAVTGDDYEVAHEGSGSLYSTCQQMERVNGTIRLDAGVFQVEMPPASTRTLLHRGRVKGPPLGLAIQEFQRDEAGLSRLSITVGDDFPRTAASAYAWHGPRIYELAVAGDELVLSNRGEDGLSFLTTPDYSGRWSLRRIGLWGTPLAVQEERRDEEELFQELERVLIGNSFGTSGRIDQRQASLADHLVRMFVYAPLPEAFHARGPDFTDEYGYVLYVVDLPAPDAIE